MTVFAHPRALSAVAAGFFLWVSPPAQAQRIHSLWDGSTGDWTSTANWIHTPGDLGADYPDNDELTYDVEITGGEINMDGAFTVGRLTLSGGYLAGFGGVSLTLNDGLHTSGELIRMTLPQITILGTSVWQAVKLEFLETVMEANHFGSLALGDGTVVTQDEASSLNNHGTLLKSSGIGTMLFSGEGQFNNFGTIRVDTGTLAIAQPGAIRGVLHVGDGARLDFVHPFGNVHFVSGTSFNGPGTVRFAQGWSQFDAPATNHTTLELSQTGFFGDGPFLNNSNGLVRLLTNSEWDVDTINLGVLRVHGPSTISSRRFENRGLVEIVTSVYGPHNFAQAHFVNHGELRSVAAAPVDLGVSVSVYNEGLIHVTAGELHLSGGGTNAGSLTTTSNAVIVLSGDQTFADGGAMAGRIHLLSTGMVTGNSTNFGIFESAQAILGPGNLYVAGGGTLFWSGEMGGTGATIVLPGGTLVSSDYATLSDRTIRNDGSMRLEGHMTCDGGRILNRGNLDISLPISISSDVFGEIPVLENEGVLTISSIGGPVTFERIDLINRGDVLIESEGLRFTRAYVQTAGQTVVRGGALLGESGEADIDVFGGRLALSGTNRCDRLTVDGTLQLASGSFINTRQIVLANASVVECEIGPAGSGSVDGDEWSILNGTLRLRLAQGFLPAAGMRYTLLRRVVAGTQFSRYEGLEIGNGLRLVPHYTGSDLEVVVMNAPYPGQRALVLELPRFQPLSVSWPSEFAGFYLQHTTNLSNPQWATMLLTWTNGISLSAGALQEFFRLVPP